jgi:hypothetical protein
MTINRREMLAGAAVLFGSAHLPFAMGALPRGAGNNGQPGTNPPEKPKNLLASTFTPELLSRSLISTSDWRPYPKASEREAWQQVHKEVAEKAVARAEKINGTVWETLPATVFLEYKRTGNRSHFESHFFTRRTRLLDLVLGECVEGKGRFLDEIVNGIWLECEETFWGLPAHLNLQRVHSGSGLPDVQEPIVDLFAADAGAVMSWIHYLLGEQLDQVNPMITRRIEFEVKRRILDPALERDDFLWMFKEYKNEKHRLNNWTPWINSNWLTANLLLEPDANRRKAAILKSCRSVDQYLEDYSPDACCQEGPGYWNVSPGSYFDCCTLLASATGGAGNPLTNPFVRKMFRYIADVHINGPWFVDYGDAPPKMEESGEFLYLIGTAINDTTLQAYGAFNASAAALRGEAVTDDQGHLGRVLPCVLVSAKAIAAEKRDALVRDSWYPDLGLMTARVKEESTDGFYLAMQAAPNQRAHGHNDSGSFIVFHDGKPIFIDIGPEAYTAPRYKFSVQSAFHNLPTVGGVMQSNQSPKYRASDLHYSSDDSSASVSMNLATAYPDEAGISHWKRTLTLDRAANRIRLNEDFQLHKKTAVQLSFMTSCVPSQGPEGKVLFTPADASARAVSISYNPALIVPSIEKIDLTDDWLISRWGKTIYRVLLTSTAPTDKGNWEIEFA